MSGETLGLLIGGIVCMAILVLVHFAIRRATRKEVDESDLWNEVYRKEEDLEYPELFADHQDDTLDEDGVVRSDSKKHFHLSSLAKKLRESNYKDHDDD